MDAKKEKKDKKDKKSKKEKKDKEDPPPEPEPEPEPVVEEEGGAEEYYPQEEGGGGGEEGYADGGAGEEGYYDPNTAEAADPQEEAAPAAAAAEPEVVPAHLMRQLSSRGNSRRGSRQSQQPEPSFPPVTSEKQMDHGTLRKRLIRFFEYYNPNNLANVDAILEQYSGCEEDLIPALIARYGPEPEESSQMVSHNDVQPTPQGSTIPEEADVDFNGPMARRVIRYYAYHNPEKLSEVHLALAHFAGREEELFENLTKKYGAEPPAEVLIPYDFVNIVKEQFVLGIRIEDAEASMAELSHHLSDAGRRAFQQKIDAIRSSRESTRIRMGVVAAEFARRCDSLLYPQGKKNYRDRLIDFYAKHNPSKLNDVDQTLEHFAGREEEMFQLLQERYGKTKTPLTPPPGMSAAIEVPPAVDARSKCLTTPAMQRRYQCHSRAPNFLNKIWSPEHDPIRALGRDVQQKVGPIGNSNIRDRIVQFYSKYNPTKLAEIDKAFNEWQWDEAEFLYNLIEKYGPEGTFEPYHPYRERLYKYLAYFDASALVDAEVLLKHFTGSEDELFRLLHERFGDYPNGSHILPNTVSRTASILLSSHHSGSVAGSNRSSSSMSLPPQPYIPQQLNPSVSSASPSPHRSAQRMLRTPPSHILQEDNPPTPRTPSL
eukprot:PhF_6_TR40209/c0_g1_i2/m.59706